ncbi:MAG: cupin domain-containing protein, partial [Spirochaetota bacterium]
GLVPHAHPVPETVFCLEGEVTTNVDGREWVMRPGDVLRVPAGAAHQTGNASATDPGRIFVMLPSAQITRTLVDVADAKRMVRGTEPPENAERVSLDATADLAPGEIRRVMPGLAVARAAKAAHGTVCECDRIVYGVSGSASVRTPQDAATVEVGGSLFVPAGVPVRWLSDTERATTLLVAYEIEDATELTVDASLFGDNHE